MNALAGALELYRKGKLAEAASQCTAALARAPQDARRHDEPLCHCPACGRVYWRGSHYKRMSAKLNAWQELKCRE